MSKVSIICLCHNQAPYLEEALASVLEQTHENVELIIVDDGSSDGSKAAIEEFLLSHPNVPYIDIESPIGNCAAFNRGWKETSGEFIIDLAADDILLPNRVAVGVEKLLESGAGVHFSNAELISERGDFIGLHNDRFSEPIPEGDIYVELVSRYLICPPTMMIKNEVLEKLNGYDESLAFEDFDFWVRSSREYSYSFSDEVLVKKRVVKHSHAQTQDRFRNSHQNSILKVCRKILELNKNEEEGKALKKRCWHEIRQCIKKGNLGLIPSYLSIIKQC